MGASVCSHGEARYLNVSCNLLQLLSQPSAKLFPAISKACVSERGRAERPGPASFIHQVSGKDKALCMALFDWQIFKKHASTFLKEKLNDVRLALTDVSRMQLLAEEATNEDPCGPETRTMAILADAAFELEEYEKIVHVIHQRLNGLSKRPWSQRYNTLFVLEYLIIHGPKSLGMEFTSDILLVEELCQSNLIEQQGIERALIIRRKADKVLELLINPDFRNKERLRARKLSVGMRGLGGSYTEERACQNMRIQCNADELWGVQALFMGLIDQPGKRGAQTLECQSQADRYEKCPSMTVLPKEEYCRSPVNENLLKTSLKHFSIRSYRRILTSPGCIRKSWSKLREQADIDTLSKFEDDNICLLDALEKTDRLAFDEDLRGALVSDYEDAHCPTSQLGGVNRPMQVDSCDSASGRAMAVQPAVPKLRMKSQKQWQPARVIDSDLKFGKAA